MVIRKWIETAEPRSLVEMMQTTRGCDWAASFIITIIVTTFIFIVTNRVRVLNRLDASWNQRWQWQQLDQIVRWERQRRNWRTVTVKPRIEKYRINGGPRTTGCKETKRRWLDAKLGGSLDAVVCLEGAWRVVRAQSIWQQYPYSSSWFLYPQARIDNGHAGNTLVPVPWQPAHAR